PVQAAHHHRRGQSGPAHRDRRRRHPARNRQEPLRRRARRRSLQVGHPDRKSTRLNSSHVKISYAVFCLKKKKEYMNNVKHTQLPASAHPTPRSPSIFVTTPASPHIYTLSLHDALPISCPSCAPPSSRPVRACPSRSTSTASCKKPSRTFTTACPSTKSTSRPSCRRAPWSKPTPPTARSRPACCCTPSAKRSWAKRSRSR